MLGWLLALSIVLGIMSVCVGALLFAGVYAYFARDLPAGELLGAVLLKQSTKIYDDNWTLGYTPELVVGVWMGNSNNTPMQQVPGSLGAAPIWHNVMERVLNNVLKVPAHDFAVPPGVTRAEICVESGLRPTELCPPDHRRVEFFVAGEEPTEPDDVWQHLQCQGGAVLPQVYMDPPHDVDDLIPYDQIVNWAERAGWNVLPLDGGPCVSHGMQPQKSDRAKGPPPGKGKKKK
ncbi:MAG: hypothetical protein ABI874_13855 [Chloroflexota bacterium]